MSQETTRDAAARVHPMREVRGGPGTPQPPDRADTVTVPRHRTLDGFVEAVSEADGIGLTDVDVFT